MPLTLCRDCRSQLRSRNDEYVALALALAFLAGAVVALFKMQLVMAGALLATSLIVVASGRWQKLQVRAKIRKLVATVPEYRELLESYPEAELVLL